ncbi:protein-export chaperone SecB [Pseudohalocynthiibacter aestuariivivens]|jgi:preprotein translocase subunit SecB|uniref:Protein-export protein SecB n=1 Tax=Pseudohalocynthiibacter aestuariivivens TaxID=1591409 RepID=A0ABV5JK07_9RHOB|nr:MULTISPECIES: protein-export chaperone SecB [Pseudohalocynthiibacter]MBS9717664.1 protein-export chaperone SecB [Pseudohalocynthiibacter aestuariivivens]MCK0102862.1 protein-export chaperone SecB [Pseudohalocynthiibacter sp. F2068]
MAENENGAQPQAQPEPVKMQVLGQFTRDLSFENILVQKGAQGEVLPDIQVQVTMDAKKRSGENQYEVISKYKIEAKNKSSNDPLFLLELEYGGVFQIENLPEEQLHPYLMIECPRMLFPFVRRIVSDITRDGGFPPLNMETIDFVALYRQEIARRAEAEKANQPVS